MNALQENYAAKGNSLPVKRKQELITLRKQEYERRGG
jgi:hypothetical protein